jgi:hypothetical protein
VRLKTLLAVLAVASVGTSAALAAPPPGKGKPPPSGAGCKPMVSVVLKGTLASTPGPSATSLSVNVTSANKMGRAWVSGAQPVSVAVDAKTKIRRQGKKTVGDLLSGDRVMVQARACKADLGGTTLPALTAVRVMAHPAKTTTTTTTTTTSDTD